MTKQGNTSPPSSFASKEKIILGVLMMMGISSIILLFGYFGVRTALSSFHPSQSLLNSETFVILWSIIIPINTIINVKTFIKYLNKSGSFTPLLSTKRLIIGILITDAVAWGIAFLVPFPFSLPTAFIIDLLVLSRYWKWKKRSIAILLLVLMSISLVIHFLVPFPYYHVMDLPIGISIIIWWLTPKTPVSGNQYSTKT